MEKSTVPSLEDVVEPSTFVHAYKVLNVSEYIGRLAPSLGRVIIYSLFNPSVGISKEFIDPETFLGLTHFHPAILKALSLVNKNLQSAQGAITLPLTQEMGFGKTHFLTLLWHLYTEVPQRWSYLTSKVELEDSIDKITKEAYYRRNIAAETIIMALDLKTIPEFMDPYTALFETCARIVDKYGKSGNAEKKKLSDFIRKLAQIEPKTAATELAKFLRVLGTNTPILILLDELYASVYETAQGGDERGIARLRDLIMFVTSFIDEIREYSPISLVYASAQQDIERWNTLIKIREHLIKTRPAVASLLEIVKHFKDRTSRVQIEMEQTTPEDVINVTIKRLFRFKLARTEAFGIVAKGYLEVVGQLLGSEVVPRYYQSLRETYPLAPTYRFLTEKLLAPTIGGDLPRTQHVRDLLKITASLIARVYEGGEWNKASLVSPAYLVHEDVNHLLEERYSMEWGRLYEACQKSIGEIKDEKAKLLAQRMLSVVYVKSLTTNIAKLLDMVRAPETIPRREALTRGSSSEDLYFSLIGAVSTDYLVKFHDARQYLANSTPYIVDVEHAGTRFMIMSFVVNPLELIESFKNEEISQYRTPEGKVEREKMLDYFRRHLESEYQITSKFTEVSQKEGKPNLVLINYDLVSLTNRGEKPTYLDYLDRNRFTVLVVTPWSVISEQPTDYAEETRKRLQQDKNKVIYPNMLASVIPTVTYETLQRLCERVAEVHASTRVVDYFKVREISESRQRRLELARRTPTYQTLLDLLEREERGLEDIIIEIMDSLQKRIEEYAGTYTNTAVQDYVIDFVGLFRQVVHYDLKEESFKRETLSMRYEAKEGFGKVYGELPVWISDAVMSKCAIDTRNAIMSKLIEYVVKPEVAKHKDELLLGEKLTLDAEPYIEAMMRGWKELPIRPLSRRDAEAASRLLTGTYFVNVEKIPQVKVSSLVTKRDDREIVQIVIEVPMAPPPPPPPPGEVKGMLIGGVNDVIIGLELLKANRLGSNTKVMDLGVKTKTGCWFKIENAEIKDLNWILGTDAINVLVNRLSSISPELEHAELGIRLSNPMKREDAEKILDIVGVSRKSVSLRTEL